MRQPFGDPDGSRGPIEEHEEHFIALPQRFGAIARPVHEATRTRVIGGAQGAGKTLYLRRLQNYLNHDSSLYASRPVLTAQALPTEVVVRVSQLYPRSANSEMWKRLWDRSILISASSHALRDASTFGSARADDLTKLQGLLHQFLPKRTGTRQVLEVAAQLCQTTHSRRELDALLALDIWADIRELLHEVLRASRPVYLFVDAIDDNFRWAPAYWLTCQRGLFYSVMDVQRTDVEAGRLHIIIAVRDLVLSSIARGEHATRYMSPEYILPLDWTWSGVREFFREKLQRLPETYFSGKERTPASFFGREHIRNESRQIDEPIEQYFLRHTRLNPRDIVILGNAVAALIGPGQNAANVPDSKLRKRISQTTRLLANAVVGQVANQIVTDVMPWNASRHEFLEPYLTTDEYHAEGLSREILSILGHAQTDMFDRQRLAELEVEAARRFGEGVRLADVLWQNCLLGYREANEVRFYAGASDLETTIPTDAAEYLLNPIVFDLVPALESTKGSVLFPGCGES